MTLKRVVAYLSARWAEGSTRRNLAIVLTAGAALIGVQITEVQVEQWLTWLNGVMVLAGLLGVFLPDTVPETRPMAVTTQRVTGRDAIPEPRVTVPPTSIP